MAASRIPTTQLLSEEFVNCAGSILFRHTTDQPLQICFLHHLTKDEWLLPKGRQDRGESLEKAAVRETFEETGFPCVLLPVDMYTRSPEAGVDMKDEPVFVKGCTEPFTVSLRNVNARNIKFIWWFITTVPDNGGERRSDTQMSYEKFEAVFCDVDIAVGDEAALDSVAARLTYTNDREIVKNAIRLVANTYPHWFAAPKSKDATRMHWPSPNHRI